MWVGEWVVTPKQTQTRYTVFLNYEFRITVQYYYGMEENKIKNEVKCYFNEGNL